MRLGGVWAIIGVSVLSVAMTSCGSSSSTESTTANAASAPAQSTPVAPAASGGQIDMDQIFPQGNGRDLVLENCQSCHTFVPIVVLQKDKDSWQHWTVDHREKVPNVSDEQFKAMFEYLVANFGPHRPVPQLPKELLDSWTTY
jgi:mono/diheme cytochrome c family protein